MSRMIETVTDTPAMPARDPSGHKGTFGTVGVVGGGADTRSGRTMLGGPVLSALASLRCGAGLARLAMPEPLLIDALASAPVVTGVAIPVTVNGEPDASACAPRLDALSEECDALVVGPALGVSDGASAIVHRLIGGGQEQTPVVLDADGLNNLAGMSHFAKEIRAPCVVTPHVGEFRRLAGPLGIEADPADPDGRLDASSQLAQRLGVVVVLKSSSTVISDGLRAWTHEGGDARLATAGTGDVLSGVLASFITQFHRRPHHGGVAHGFERAAGRPRALRVRRTGGLGARVGLAGMGRIQRKRASGHARERPAGHAARGDRADAVMNFATN